MKNAICTTMIILSLVMMPIPAGSQVATGGSFTLEQAVIAGGGGQNSTGSSGGTTFSVDGTIGQAIAGTSSAGGTFSLTSGFWNPTAAGGSTLEADVAPRPNGNGLIESNDVIQVRRFLNEIDAPSTVPNEFQRADSAPRGTQGDGAIDSADVIQTIRYLNEVDALQNAGGPLGPSGLSEGRQDGSLQSYDIASTAKTPRSAAAALGAPELRVESRSGTAGQMVTVNIRVDALGTESQYAFALNFDQTRLTYTSFSAGTTGANVFSCNPSAITPGRIRCDVGGFLVNNPSSSTPVIGEIPAGNDQILIRVTFLIANGAATGPTPLDLNTQSASNDAGVGIPLPATDGTLTVTAPNAASVSVAGRLLTAEGSGVTNATVTLADSFGSTRSVLTGPFGYFAFDGVAAGQTYIVSVHSKRYRFSPQVVTVVDDVTGLVFVAEP